MENRTVILGISAFYHDSAAALIIDGVVVAAAEEERFTRIKHESGFPQQAAAYCLKEAGISIDDVSYVVFYEKPFLHFERLLMTAIDNFPRGLMVFVESMVAWLGKKLYVGRRIRTELSYKGEVLYVAHHLSHAASAFFCSG